MARRELPEINASSMADIAFLLLTFFLIATTLNREEGIQRIVPDPDKPLDEETIVHERNLYRILVNQQGAVQINGANSPITDIKDGVQKFVDNGGGESLRKSGEKCDYCQGSRDPLSSDTPHDAIISIELDNATPYNYFYLVENQIDQAFYDLYDQYSQSIFKMSYDDVKGLANKKDAPTEDIERLQEVEAAYPKNIAKARLRQNLN